MNMDDPPINPPGRETKLTGATDVETAAETADAWESDTEEEPVEASGDAGDDSREIVEDGVVLVEVDADGEPDIVVVVELEEPPYNPPDNSSKGGPDAEF